MEYSRRGLIVSGAAMASASTLPATQARASVVGHTVDYMAGGAPMEGYLAYDENIKEKRPGVIVVHTRRGIGDFILERTRTLAGLGYVAFAADVFGKGIRPVEDAPSARESGKLKQNRSLTRQRITAAFDLLRANDRVAGGQIAVIGYCMGGMVALELARSGAPVLATVSFHGTLSTPTPEDARNIRGRVLVLHGADDHTAKIDEVFGMVKEMRDAEVAFDLHLYGRVLHGFTETKNGFDPSKGKAYDAHADKESWAAMRGLFSEVFQT